MNFPRRYKYQKKYFLSSPKNEKFGLKANFLRLPVPKTMFLGSNDRLINSNKGYSHFSKIVSCSSAQTRLISNFEISKKQEQREKKDISLSSSQFQFPFEIPNLVDIQRTSFFNFVNQGLIQAFPKALSFSTPTETLEIKFFPELVQFRQPEFTQKQAFVLGQTYSSSIYIPVSIKSSLSSTRKLEWFLVGSLPLMTKHGHFVINGIPRVVLHQMVRNPGVYTLPRDSRTQASTVRIVPEKGGWINLTVDKKYRLWFSTRTLRRKVSLLVILQALGFSKKDLFERFKYSDILRNSFVKDFSQKRDSEITSVGKTRHDKILIRAGLYGHPQTQEEALRYLYAHFIEYNPYIRDELVTDALAREFFWTKLWNKEILLLGKIGRHQFQEKLGSGEPLNQYALTAEDLVAATQALLKLIYKERLGDEIDSLTQKRIRGCDEFLQDQLLRGIREFETFFNRKVVTLPNPKTSALQQPKKVEEQSSLEVLWRQNKSVFAKVVSKAWKSFFTSGTLAQFMDQTNPLAEVTHKRRLTVLGPGGVSSKQTTIQIRGIHPTFYGRLCPIETPEGQNAGLVNSFTVFAKPSKNLFGTIKTPFFQVYKGQVQKELPPLFVAPHQEEILTTAPADISLNSWNFLPNTLLPVRKEFKFDYEKSTQITTQAVGVLQTISVATSLIPFLEHDDGNRALMGSNMQRQAVPLLNPEPPLVGTGLETRVVSDVNHVIQASQSGYVTNVTSKQIQTLSPSIKTKFLGSSSFFQNTVNCFKKVKPEQTSILNFSIDSKIDKTPIFLELNKTKYNPALKTKFLGLNEITFKNQIFGQTTEGIENFGVVDKSQMAYSKIHKISFLNKKRIHGLVRPTIRFSSFSQKFKTYTNLPGENLSSFLFNTKEKNLVKNFTLIESFSLLTKESDSLVSKNKSSKNQKNYKLQNYQRTNQSTCFFERPSCSEGIWVEKGDILADGAASAQGKLSIGKNILVAYLPWEGYNFEDAILISERLVNQDIFTSLHIDHYDIEVKNTQYGLEKITNQIPLKIDQSTRDIRKRDRLNSQGLIKIGSWVEEGDYLVGKVSPLNPKGPSVEQQYEKLYNVIMQREKTQYRNTSLRVPKGVEGFVLDVQILPSREADVAALAEKDAILRVRIVLLQRRRIQVGDKMAGRHGNKGIVSNILPQHDMPYLPDGTPIDIVLNPLGVPSRMNVGQILECLLGLAGRYLNETYSTHLFDEKFGAEASRSLVYSKLYEASVKTGNTWLFEPQHPGKIRLFDGRTGLPFDQPVTVGCAYILKLVHLVDDKIHARSTGPYSAVTQQPVRGRSRNGGQRLGEMEVWALQAYGAAQTLHELLTLKSDDVEGRKQAVFQIYANKRLPFGRPESFKLILRELQALCFDLQLYGFNKQPQNQRPFSLWKLTQFLEENRVDFLNQHTVQKA
uniref:DNA-directed RNA polymerase subunit beta n=1 Tax=Chlorella sorokiniana TaxID=3076 RepID=W8SY80_CHLSO|nr:DNA-directed RNA polymerase subunit beta [Chlorella sorokiniana]AHM23713.1 DNA-directed RNA polymerase subunit beta [Chlorella sorokiniana]AII02083.1 RNA polymerase beta subunit [Chlorella sorokiniana]